MTTNQSGTAEHAAPLDALLVEGALGVWRRFLPPEALELALSLGRRPVTVGRRLGSLSREVARIAVGTSTHAPSSRDRRFADTAWSENGVLRRAVQVYLAALETSDALIGDATLSWGAEQRVRLAAVNLQEALAPSNWPLLNPAALKAAIDTGGRNYAAGLRNLADDMRAPPRVPSMVDRSAFTVGDNIGATPGAVVLRTPVFELIQYAPQTETVHEVPVLFLPPTINKFYIVDLAPERSMIEHILRAGHQVFLMSWRNPRTSHRDWNLDTYIQAALDALAATEQVSGSPQTIPFGLCSGGIILGHTLGYLAATGTLDRIAAFTYGVSVLDQERAGTASALTSPAVAEAALAVSARKGYVDGRQLAEVFAWLRPGDLIWNYWVNNYLLGKKPPAFDILFWNADTTRMTAGLHRDFLRFGLDNPLTEPGKAQALDLPVDLSKVTQDGYVVAGIADHITPWQNCFRSARLFGGTSRFVLSTSGHIAALVNPPGNAKSTFRSGPDVHREPQQWLAEAETTKGSWWPDYIEWLSTRSGGLRPAPEELGSADLPPLDAAPGTYVLDH